MTRQDDIVETDKIFGFLKPQPGKGSRLGSAYDWARAKAIADIPVEEDRKLWRVHDALYDFSDFDHPGILYCLILRFVLMKSFPVLFLYQVVGIGLMSPGATILPSLLNHLILILKRYDRFCPNI